MSHYDEEIIPGDSTGNPIWLSTQLASHESELPGQSELWL